MQGHEHRAFVRKYQNRIETLGPAQRIERLGWRLSDRTCDIERSVDRNFHPDAAAERLQVGVGEGIGILARTICRRPVPSACTTDGMRRRASGLACAVSTI